jgi:hypothetical protein
MWLVMLEDGFGPPLYLVTVPSAKGLDDEHQ